MTAFKPSTPYVTALTVLTPEIVKINGVRTKKASNEGFRINASFRTFGGTETTVNGILAIEDTAQVETWYRPDITSDKLIRLEPSGALYEIIGEPEDVQQRHQFIRFKVRRFKGGA